jgi:hypothetical protein
MRHWQHIVGRRSLQLIDEIDDSGQFVHDVIKLRIGELQSRERCDVLDLISS